MRNGFMRIDFGCGRTDAGLAVRVQVISVAASAEKGTSGVDAILTASAVVGAALVDVDALAYVPEYFMETKESTDMDGHHKRSIFRKNIGRKTRL
jgi:tRNA U38,U39,U40 pseudouridine synthase TruA